MEEPRVEEIWLHFHHMTFTVEMKQGS